MLELKILSIQFEYSLFLWNCFKTCEIKKNNFTFNNFAIFQIACLGHGLHRIMDAISECEQHTRSQGMRESSSTWRLYFRKEFFTPWCDPNADTLATDLTYQQIMRGVSVGEYKCEKVGH